MKGFTTVNVVQDKKFEYKAIIVNINIHLFDLLNCSIWCGSFSGDIYSIIELHILLQSATKSQLVLDGEMK